MCAIWRTFSHLISAKWRTLKTIISNNQITYIININLICIDINYIPVL